MSAKYARRVNLQLEFAKALLNEVGARQSNESLAVRALLNAALFQLEQSVVWYLAECEASVLPNRGSTAALVDLSSALTQIDAALAEHSHILEIKTLASTQNSWLNGLLSACQYTRTLKKDDSINNSFFESDADVVEPVSNSRISVMSNDEPDLDVEVMLAWCDCLQELLLRQREQNIEF